MPEIKKKSKEYLVIAIAILSVIAIGFTVAYFQGQIGAGATANVTVTAKTTDVLTFSKGSDINVTATQSNFGSGAGNRTGSTTATATLLANNDTNSATNTYNVYLFIQSNSFTYTTSPTNTPELMLTITNPNNQAVTSLTGLTYTTSGGVSGFDVTTKSGLIQIASNYSITSTGTKTDTWNVTVTFVNLNSDQQFNTGKTFEGRIIIQKDAISTSYWNDSFAGQYVYSYPLGQKITNEDYNNNPTNLVSGSPTTYPTLAQLQSNYANFSTNPVYIKTTAEHQACVYYNNHEFCMSPNYWAGTIGVIDSEAALATNDKLKADMENAFQEPITCNYINSSANCGFGYFYCDVYYHGKVSCRFGGSGCNVMSDWAYCSTYTEQIN